MKTYIFAQKNGSGSLILSAESKIDAYDELDEIVMDVDGWRLTEIHDEDGEYVDF